MKLTSKQRAQLRSLAADIPTIMQIGKDGIGENLIKTVGDALEARELIKLCSKAAARLRARRPRRLPGRREPPSLPPSGAS